jgi:DNA-binding transcriptional regulator YiaG
MTELYRYTECGLPNVWLRGVETHETPYGPGTAIPGIENLHRVIGLAIAESNRQMTGAEVRFLRTELDLSQRMLAALLDVRENTLRRWELGETRIPGPAQRALAGYYIETVRADGSLRELMLKLAESDRDLAGAELRFERHGEEWSRLAA